MHTFKKSVSDYFEDRQKLKNLFKELSNVSAPPSLFDQLPNELHNQIISYLSLREVYLARGISRWYCELCLEHIQKTWIKKIEIKGRISKYHPLDEQQYFLFPGRDRPVERYLNSKFLSPVFKWTLENVRVDDLQGWFVLIFHIGSKKYMTSMIPYEKCWCQSNPMEKDSFMWCTTKHEENFFSGRFRGRGRDWKALEDYSEGAFSVGIKYYPTHSKMEIVVPLYYLIWVTKMAGSHRNVLGIHRNLTGLSIWG
jgi:hypothetical protein